MFRTALRNVLAHKARLLMTVLAVMLGVAFVSGTLVFTNTLSNALQNSSAKGFDHVDVAVRAQDREDKGDTVGRTPELTQALLDRSAHVPGAASAVGVVRGFTALADKDGKLVGDGFMTEGGNYWGTKDPPATRCSPATPRPARARSSSTPRPPGAPGTRSATPSASPSTGPSSRRGSPASSPPTTATSPPAAAWSCSTRPPRSSCSASPARTTRSM
ncbi:hypothetical protein GCM10020256_46250 [Streptomyces thermocoprophilus]